MLYPDTFGLRTHQSTRAVTSGVLFPMQLQVRAPTIQQYKRLVILAFFAIFVAQSFHIPRTILRTFAIFATFAISSILF